MELNKMLMYSVLGVVVGGILSYLAYNYIDVNNTDEELSSTMKSVHLRTGLICGLSVFVVLFVINRNHGPQTGGSSTISNGVNSQLVNTGQPGW